MPHYTYLWEFRANAGRIAKFEREYGPAGAWAGLFRRAPGYPGTLLLRDSADALRFVTVARWQSAEDYRAFRARFGAEYASLDARSQALTVAQRALGEYEEAGS